MKLEKITFKIIIAIFAFVMLIPFITSANIGVSPASINFNDVLRGGYSERSIMISIDSERLIGVEVKSRGEVAEWLNFSTSNFTVSKQEPYQLKISVSPPEDMPNE